MYKFDTHDMTQFSKVWTKLDSMATKSYAGYQGVNYQEGLACSGATRVPRDS